jgi:hypothetical protein
MAFRLRMPAEIGDWLAGFAASEPEAAAETGAALLALMRSDAIPGPPLATDPDELAAVADDPRELLDYRYQRLLTDLQPLRRELAETAYERERTERLVQAAEPGSPLRAHLAHRLDAARQLEAALRRRTELLQQHVDAFRARKETAKAVVTAEEARLRIQEALRAAGQDEDAGPAPAEPDLAADESAARLQRARADAFRLLGIDPAAGAHPARPEADVLELRPDPLGSDARILFAEEPTGTITVLAVLEDAAAVAEHHDAALDLACELLEEIRDDGWPTDSLDFADGDGFITTFFPARGPDLTRRAAALGRATSLTRLREGAGLTAAELAERGGLSHDAIGRIDRLGPGEADVGDVAAYARALGGTLRLIVDLDGEEHGIR